MVTLTVDRGRVKDGQIIQTEVLLCSEEKGRKETPINRLTKKGNRGKDQYLLSPGGRYKVLNTVRKSNGRHYRFAVYFRVSPDGQDMEVSLH